MAREGEAAMVPRAEPRSYYGQPVLKEPVWTWEIPAYFFAGGLAGASAGLAWMSELRGNDVLARRAWMLSAAGIAASPGLLISDLGRPDRFLNMLRMFKVTSPMSVGSWLLTAAGGAVTIAAADSALPKRPRRRPGGASAWRRRAGRRPPDGRRRRRARRAIAAAAPIAKPAAAALGLPLSTYTGALVANTAVPAWHEARWTLPLLFGGGAAASAGAAATIATPQSHAAPARRLALVGAVIELVAARGMEQQLGELARPYHEGRSGTYSRAAQLATAAGGIVLGAFGGRRRSGAVAGAYLVAAGALLERWAVYKAGFASAADPAYTVGPQRERIDRGETRGASRRAGDLAPS